MLSYLPQFGSPTDSIRAFKLLSIHRILYLPNNALLLAMEAHLKDKGRPKIRSMATVKAAVAGRFGFCNNGFILSLLGELIEAAQNHAHIRRFCSGEVSPVCWKSAPMAVYLTSRVHGHDFLFARLGVVSVARHGTHASIRRENVRDDVARSVLEKVTSPGRTGMAQLQTQLTRQLELDWVGDDTAALSVSKLTGGWPEPARFLELCKVNKKCPPRVAMAVYRTLLDGWPTAARYQKPIEQCFSGCRSLFADGTHSASQPGQADLRHYMVCPRLWHIVKFIISAPMPPGVPTSRLLGGDGRPQSHALFQLAMASRLCHSVALDAALVS